MKTARSILSIVALALIFVSCNSDTALSPAVDVATEVGSETELTKAAAPTTATVILQPINSQIQWQLELQVEPTQNGQFSGQGTFEMPLKGGVIFIPVGRVRVESQGSGNVAISLRARTPQGSQIQVRLQFRGVGTKDPKTQTITGTGSVQGDVRNPLTGKIIDLSGPAQIIIDFTSAG